MYKRIGTYGLELDSSFYDVIVPITKEYVKVFNRDHGNSLAEIATTCGYLKANDQELWTLIFKKLLDDGLLQYVTLPRAIYLLEALTVHGGFSQHPVLETLTKTVLKHKNYYKQFPEYVQVLMRIRLEPAIERVAPPQISEKLKELA